MGVDRKILDGTMFAHVNPARIAMLTRNRHMRRMLAAALAGAAAAALTTPAAVAREDEPALTNGGFETGTFAGWHTADVGNTGDGWSVAGGTVSPVSGFTIPAPPQGVSQAVVDQTGPGSHVLYRDIRVDDDLGLTISLWYANRAGVFFTPRTLDPFSQSNQQLRVDLVRPTARLRSMKASDILATIFRTRVGAPAQIAPRVLRRDLSRFEGRTVRLRIAEVDNQFFFQAGVDAVRLVEIEDGPGESWPEAGRRDLRDSGAATAAKSMSQGSRYVG